MTGDWCGRREHLRDNGVTFDVSATAYYQGTAAGGLQDAFLFDTTFSLSPLLPVDPATRTLIFRAVDQHGAVGPPMTLDLKIQASALATDTPPPLEVTLTWDT